MPVSFSVIKKPLPPTRQINIMRQEVLKLTQPVIKHHIARREQATSRFTHKPRYESRIYIRNGVTITILLKNAGERVGKATLATLMDWLYKTGTRAHPIVAKTGKFLAFTSGPYKRKTEGGSGSSGGETTVYRKRVRHPGFAPSKQLDRIDKDLERPLGIAIEAGGRIGLNKAKNG